MRVEGIEVWDGRTALGSASVEWELNGPDAVFTSVVASPQQAASAGLTLIPGLIDTHVHLLGYAGEGSPDFMTWPILTRPEERAMHGLANAISAAANGVTTVRDLAGEDAHLGLRNAVADALFPSARILVHGSVGMTAGHADLFTPATFPIRGPVADGVDEVRKLVRTWARAGADGIKVATGGGVLSEGDRNETRNFTDDELAAAVDEAHAVGLPVAAHAHTERAIDRAIEHGVDSIEHGTLITENQASMIAASRASVAPTVLINERIAQRKVPVSEAAAAKAQALLVQRDARFALAAAAGVRFVLGTDANGFHVRFGEQMEELRRMAALFGWSAERTLVSATSDAAETVGAIGRLGAIGVGAAADFVIMRGAPHQQVDHIDVDRIVAVVCRGRLVAGALP